ncbi:MAG TPA: hypothetical protein VIL70_01880 [Chthoniobacterales bacterium]|jgi:hypothetical protein
MASRFSITERHHKGHKHFLQHIPNAVRSLRNVVAKIDKLKPFWTEFVDCV